MSVYPALYLLVKTMGVKVRARTVSTDRKTLILMCLDYITVIY